MGIEKLISLAAALAIAAALSGRLPKIIYALHMAEIRMVNGS